MMHGQKNIKALVEFSASKLKGYTWQRWDDI